MKRKAIPVLLVCVLLLLRLNLPAIGCCEGSPPGDPHCYNCEDGVWVLIDGAECGQTLDCTFGGEGCEICVDCMCEDDDTLCEPDECCIDGRCIGPICEGCHTVTDRLDECGHMPGDVNCQQWFCIANDVNTAACDFRGYDWPCHKMNCNCTADENNPEIVQTARYTRGLCGSGEPVVKVPYLELWCGCESCGPHSYDKACVPAECPDHLPFWFSRTKGTKRKCGCP